MGIKKNEKHILVVEDDAELCNSIMKALFDQGYTPAGATDIKDAAFKLKNQKYNCILLDLKLHNDSGVDLLVYI
ncbi:MAG TPA: response regulator, partial [Chitinophagales bacterium]|nr:response regulator [Chitinophagales bacterium]